MTSTLTGTPVGDVMVLEGDPAELAGEDAEASQMFTHDKGAGRVTHFGTALWSLS